MFPQMKKIGKIRQVLESFKKGSWSLQKASPLTYYHTEIEISQKCFQLIKRPKIGGKIPIYATKCFNSSNNSAGTIDRLTFSSVCTETLDSLTEYFEELIESVPHLKNADVNYSDGVLTVHFGPKYGTYVINRQTPNLQIWLSSPSSGPKRYDFLAGTWIYKHDNTTLHSLLDKEIKEIANKEVEFEKKCMHAKYKK